MKGRLNKKKIIYLSLLIVAIIIVLLIRNVSRTEPVYTSETGQESFYESSYQKYLDSHNYISGVTGPAQDEIVIDILKFETRADMNAFVHDSGVRTGETGIISWSFFVETDGFYNLEVSFIPETGTNTQIKRIISLNDEVLHSGLYQVGFNRAFRHAQETIEVKNKNEIRPRTIETFYESSVFIGDLQKRSLQPYLFFLSAGEHVLSFESINEPMVITGIRFAAAPSIPSYQDYIANVETVPYAGETLVFQAERLGDGLGTKGTLGTEGTLGIRKSLPSITVKNNFFDPALVPFHPYQIVFNTIGGDTWRFPGEIIEWDIYVPQEGLYKISFKGRQSINRGVISFRHLTINGETPFAEAQALDFEYSAVMKNYIPGEENPFLFHFKSGINTLSLEVVLGAFGAPYAEVTESVMILNDLYRRIIQITGTVPDLFIDYEVPRKIPDYTEIIHQEYERLSKVVENLNRITVEKGTNTTMVERIIEQMRRLLLKPDNITRELHQFQSNISVLASWLITVSEMPFELDSFSLLSPEANPAPARANFLRRFINNLVRFFASFFVDITAIDTEEKGSKEAIRVWFPSGRDQAQVLRSLIDQRFIPEHNINVKLELVPIDVVMPSTLAGIGPDVILNLDQTRLMDFALRNALVDLSVMDGFDEIAAQFYSSALEGITFQGRTYGLPETQTFLIMFYRRDILDSLDITPPRTWDELREVIPILHRHNYEMFIPRTGPLASLVIQKDGHFYLGEGDDFGIESGLLENPAMEAFKELTDFFTAYRLPVAMDFSNRFRRGEVPMGIADYTMYYTLELFAPEIRGLWSFAPLPGTIREDGTIDNRVVTVTTQSAIMNASVQRGRLDDAWAFMRWWMSAEVQTEYAMGIEAILGPSARYATANKDVLVQLPWTSTDAARLLEQFASTTSFPQVPGHYMTNRMIDYAFNAVVTSGANAREALFLNTKAINHELTKKRREFSLSSIPEHGGR